MGKEGWASIFGEVPELCDKISLDETMVKSSDQDSKLDYQEDLISQDIEELDYDEDFETEDEVEDSVMPDLCKNIDVKQVEDNSPNDLGKIQIENKNDKTHLENIGKVENDDSEISLEQSMVKSSDQDTKLEYQEDLILQDVVEL